MAANIKERWLVLGVGNMVSDYQRWNPFFDNNGYDFDAISQGCISQDNLLIQEAYRKHNYQHFNIDFNDTTQLDTLEDNKYDVVVFDCSVSKFCIWTVDHLKIIKKR